jgi:DNA polymerase II large subunit
LPKVWLDFKEKKDGKSENNGEIEEKAVKEVEPVLTGDIESGKKDDKRELANDIENVQVPVTDLDEVIIAEKHDVPVQISAKDDESVGQGLNDL